MKCFGSFFLFCLLSKPVAAAPQESVKFTPTVKLYECPPTFQFRSECKAHEKVLEPQKLVLNLDILNQKMGQWTLQMTEPIAASYYVIVVRGRNGNHFDYSVSSETGLPGSPSPFSNERVEFSDQAIPKSFGVSSATMEKDGKKFITEIRLMDFHGKPAQAPGKK